MTKAKNQPLRSTGLALRISTSKNHSFGREGASVQEIRFYCPELYDIVLFSMRPWADLCGSDGVGRQFRCRYDCGPIEKNGKSQGNVEGVLKLRDAASQLGISFERL
jgi:hypothetical protein